MPNSHPELMPIVDRLHRFLSDSFPASEATISPATEAPDPLLLLHLQYDVAGFVLSNGDPRRCFDQSYSFFKKLYADRHREWDQLNLTFVLCLAHRDCDLEEFCEKIETDAFFCRKFAVALDAPSWATELARLPFFPLVGRAGVFHRPPAAQTLLKSCGVPAPLAASIVGRVGEDSIVDACLDGRFGAPKLIDADLQDPQATSADAPQAIRVQRMEIENFRAYRRLQSFDLDADLIVLYGPNGFGKTSFFDAIDFAATGDIGRLRLARNKQRFAKAARHLDAVSDSSYVALTIQTQDGVRKIRRTVQQHLESSLDGRFVDRKKTLLALTAPHVSPSAHHIEHLVQLFRATHLFSQEFQTLTYDFREHCRLSTEVVSRMLAFEDYVSAGRKVAKALALIRGRVAARDRRAQEVEDALAQNRREMKRFQQSMRSIQTPQAVAALRESVCQKLASTGIEPTTDSDPVAEARGWCAVLETRISDTRTFGDRLSELAANTQFVAAKREQLSTLQAERAQTKSQLDETRAQMLEIREPVHQAETELAALQEREQTLRQCVQVLAWQRETKPTYDTLIARHIALTGKIGTLTKSQADQNESLQRLTTEFNAAEAQLAQTTRSLEVDQKLLARLADLAARYSQWERQTTRRRELEQIATQSNTLLTGLQQELQTATTDLNHATLEQRRAAAEVARIEDTQSELQNLLAALERHVTNARCPACGTHHDSKEELLLLLRAQKNTTDASGVATSRLRQTRQHSAELQERVEDLKTRRHNAEQTANAAAAELQTIIVEIGRFETLARELAWDPADVDLAARLQERRTLVDRRNRDLVQTSLLQQETVEAARAQVAAALALTQTCKQDWAAKRETLNELASQLDHLRTDAAGKQVTLDVDLQQITQREIATRHEAEDIAAQTAAKRTELNKGQTALTDRDRRVRTLKQQLDTQDAVVHSLQRAIEQHGRDLESLGLAPQAEQTHIAARAEEEANRASAFEELKQETIGLEMALDEAATAAVAAELAARIRADEAELGVLRENEAPDKLWATYFEQVRQRLEQTQHSAVAAYTDEYGPLSSIIQRRLRSVSGFEDIVLLPEKSSIDVRVTRDGEHLPPTDFFSQSQQQILMLSLFVTACTTQTWSAFAPILLDDPVTHFDDLNAYSFLDLIAGLLETGGQRRQFILSMCDEQLFQLARQRFQHLGDRAKVYRFVSAGRDGPVIEML